MRPTSDPTSIDGHRAESRSILTAAFNAGDKVLPRLPARLVALLLLLNLLLACAPRQTSEPTAPAPTVAPPTAPSGQSVELLVFAAASLTDSFQAIGKSFEAVNSGTKVTFGFGGSQQLAQ